MTYHTNHDMHANSLSALATVHVGAREKRCLDAIETLGICTDRQVMIHLELTDMNAVRPRITGLIDKGLVREVGSQQDETTGRKVRLLEVVQ